MKTHDENGPQVNVRESLPESLERNGRAVVEVTFSRVVAQNTVHENLLLLFGPPLVGSVRTLESDGGLTDGGRHDKEGHETDDNGQQAFDQEAEMSDSSGNDIKRTLCRQITYSHCQPPHPRTPRISSIPPAKRLP